MPIATPASWNLSGTPYHMVMPPLPFLVMHPRKRTNGRLESFSARLLSWCTYCAPYSVYSLTRSRYNASRYFASHPPFFLPTLRRTLHPLASCHPYQLISALIFGAWKLEKWTAFYTRRNQLAKAGSGHWGSAFVFVSHPSLRDCSLLRIAASKR